MCNLLYDEAEAGIRTYRSPGMGLEALDLRNSEAPKSAFLLIEPTMPFFSSPQDGAQLYYADYRPSTTLETFQPSPDRENNGRKQIAIVFLHGWPMSSEHLANTHGHCSKGETANLTRDRSHVGSPDPATGRIARYPLHCT